MFAAFCQGHDANTENHDAQDSRDTETALRGEAELRADWSRAVALKERSGEAPGAGQGGGAVVAAA